MKKLFKKQPKEYTNEQNSEMLSTSGIPTATSYKRPSKFSNFGDYALSVNQQRKGAPLMPSTGAAASANPYAQGVDRYAGAGSRSQGSNPYNQANNSGGVDKYSSTSSGYGNTSSDPYASSSNQSYGNSGTSYGSNSYGSNSGSGNTSNPYETAHRSYGDRFGHNLTRTETTETTREQRNELFRGVTAAKAQDPNKLRSSEAINEVDELLQLPDDVEKDTGGRDYNGGPEGRSFDFEQEQALDSEDEDVEAIKGQIRFTKQESVNSTRNTLRLAAEAEESGRNTLGMLGAQGERIANTEQNLALAEVQNKHAEEKARELKTLNRSLLKPHISNPFNSKRKAQEKEAQIRAQYQQEQIRRENRRQLAYTSQQRVMNGLNGNGMSETALKYKRENASEERKKYQFENDSEDEDLESEIDNNLDGIHAAAKRLNKLALATNEEVTSQNERLDRIGDQTDVLDVNVHLNTSRLASIR